MLGLAGEDSLLAMAEDLLVDIPKFWDFLAQVLAPVLISSAASMSVLAASAQQCLMSDSLGKTCAAGQKHISFVIKAIYFHIKLQESTLLQSFMK